MVGCLGSGEQEPLVLCMVSLGYLKCRDFRPELQ